MLLFSKSHEFALHIFLGNMNIGEVYRHSDEYKKLRASMDSALTCRQDSVYNSCSCLPSYPTSFLWQVSTSIGAVQLRLHKVSHPGHLPDFNVAGGYFFSIDEIGLFF